MSDGSDISADESDISADELENTEDELDASNELELKRFSSQKVVKKKITETDEGIHRLWILLVVKTCKSSYISKFITIRY